MSKENKTKKIFRVEKDKNYSVIHNAIFLDKRISWGAKGVLGYALTKPDDWDLYISEVVKNGTDKKEKVSRYFRELRLAGYLDYRKIYEAGKIARTEYIISEKASHSNSIQFISRYMSKKLKPEIQVQEILNQEILSQEKTSLVNTDSLPNTDINKILKEEKEEIPSHSKSKSDIFQEHHKSRLKESRLHGDPDLFLVDKLGQLVDWDTETYDKILNAKKNSKWEVRRNQPNTARWLLATLENENIEQKQLAYADEGWI